MIRKFAPIVILILLFYSASLAQSQNLYSSQIDSVRNLIESNPNDDIEKVQQLNELARLHFYNLQIKEGFIATKKALNLSEQIGFESGKVMYYLTLSAFHGNADRDMQIFYLKKAEWLSKSFGDQSRNYFVNIETPDINEGNNFEQIRDKYLEILTFFKKEEDKEIRANLLMKINYLNYRLGETEKVLEYIDRIDSIFQDLGRVYPKFLNSTYKLMIYSNIGDEKAYKNTEIELIKLFLNNKDENIIGLIASTIASGYADNGRYLLSIEYYLKSIEEFEQANDLEMLSVLHHDLGVAYENLDMNSKAVDSYKKSIDALIAIKNISNLYVVYGTIVFPLIALEEYEKARKYMELAEQEITNANYDFIQARIWDANGQILMSQKKYELAIPYFNKALNNFKNINPGHWGLAFMYLYLAECNAQLGNYKKALSQAFLCLDHTDPTDTRVYRKANLLISRIYEQRGDESNALKYLKSYQKIVEESDKLDEINRIADAEIKTILEKSNKEIVALEREQQLVNQKNKIQRLWLISAFGALLSALLLLYVFYKNNRNKQKANAQLKQQKEKVEETLNKLRSAQSQLIHSEKMASLGELTAGIAHEIQNPLNFINNFAEVNKELITELNEEVDKGDLEEIKSIAGDIGQNEDKISHHGKRADSIVKGMLQHSRSSNGQKKPTDINGLSDEYLRLAFHGMRAKDKSFNADFKLDADDKLQRVNVVPQDIGRVLLNLINNAFQAVNEKSKQNIEGYKPALVVSTRKFPQKIEITVEDNGSGIPEEIKDKIFQPFFTTKAAGEGTGLGLSLSYDIITKGHGGDLKLESNEDKGTRFTITIPIKEVK